MSNCTAHPLHFKDNTLSSKLKSVTLAYFPSDTSKLQPMDQGIIDNIKVFKNEIVFLRFHKHGIMMWHLEQ